MHKQKRRKNKLPVFLSTHPLRLESYLKFFDYRVLYYIKDGEKVFENRKRTVIVLLSLLELESFLESAGKYKLKRARIVVFSNRKEVGFFPKLKNILDIQKKRTIKIFIPHYFFLQEKINVNWSVPNMDTPIEELEKSIQLSKTFATFI
jgi:hypothetical protein